MNLPHSLTLQPTHLQKEISDFRITITEETHRDQKTNISSEGQELVRLKTTLDDIQELDKELNDLRREDLELEGSKFQEVSSASVKQQVWDYIMESI